MNIAFTLDSRTSIEEHSQEILENTLSHRLRYALDALKISQSELARRLGIKPQVIQYICANNVKKSRFTFEIAAVLNIDYIWLSAGQGQMLSKTDNLQERSQIEYRTPVLTEQQILAYTKGQFEIHATNVKNWLITNLMVPESSIGIVNTGNSMTPLFPKEAILVFDMKREPKNQNYVLAYIKSLDKLLFRQYIEHEKSRILKPLDQIIYNDVFLKQGDVILGVLIQTHYSLA